MNQEKKISFVPLINQRNEILSKSSTALLLQPVLMMYNKASLILNDSTRWLHEGCYTSESLEKCIEALGSFNYKVVKEHFEGSINSFANCLIDDDEESNILLRISPEADKLSKKIDFNEKHVTYVRNQLRASVAPFFQHISDMEKAHRYVESKISQHEGGTQKTLKGGLLGAAIGSVLLPGIGTAIGGAIGGALSADSAEVKRLNETMEHILEYFEAAEKLRDSILECSKHIYLTFNSISEKIVDQEKKIYLVLKANDLNADDIYSRYYQEELNSFNKMLKEDFASEVYPGMTNQNFIDQFYEEMMTYKKNKKIAA